MFRKVLKILIFTLVVALAVGAVSAAQDNVSDDTVAAQITDEAVSVCEDEGMLASSDEPKLSSEDDGYSTQYKTFTVAKLKIPKKYASAKYEDNPKVKKIMKKKMKVFVKKAKKKMKKIMLKGWKAYNVKEPVIKKAGKNYFITYDIEFYRNV